MMEPSALSDHLRKLASLIDRSEAPPVKTIRAEVAGIVSMLEGGRQAAKLEKMMDDDFDVALEGLDSLIRQLSKTSQTLNPQDEAKAEIEASLTELHKLRSGVKKQIEQVGAVNL